MNGLKSRLSKLLLFAFLSISVSSCAMICTQSVMIKSSFTGEPFEIKLGMSYGEVLYRLEERGISYSDLQDNPFFVAQPMESMVIEALAASYDDRGIVNGTISYKFSFDRLGILFDVKEAVVLDKRYIYGDDSK